MSTPTDEGSGFAKAWSDLETKFRAAAADDPAIYLPNLRPSGRVGAVLVAMEPSLGRWGRPPAKADEKIEAGFRNFMSSAEVFILHYSARRFLCPPGGTYHIAARLTRTCRRFW